MEFIKQSKAWENIAREAYKAQKLRKEYEELEKKLLAELKELSANENSEFGQFRFQKIERKGSIDYAAIPILKEMDLEPFRRAGTIVAWKLFKY